MKYARLIPAGTDMNWDTTREPALLTMQLGRLNEILKREEEIAPLRSQHHEDVWLIDFEKMLGACLCSHEQCRCRTPNPHGTITTSKSSKVWQKISPQETETPILPEKGTTSMNPLDYLGHKDVVRHFVYSSKSFSLTIDVIFIKVYWLDIMV